MMSKGMMIFGACFAAVLLLSSATAVPQVHSASVMNKVRSVEQKTRAVQKYSMRHVLSEVYDLLKNKQYDNVQDLVCQVKQLVKDKKPDDVLSQARDFLKEKLGVNKIAQLSEKLRGRMENNAVPGVFSKAQAYLKEIGIADILNRLKTDGESNPVIIDFILLILVWIFFFAWLGFMDLWVNIIGPMLATLIPMICLILVVFAFAVTLPVTIPAILIIGVVSFIKYILSKLQPFQHKELPQ